MSIWPGWETVPGWSLTLLTAIAVCWLLRSQVLDAYPVLTASMEPTIEGDPDQGDVVVVDKLSRSPPTRHDLVVFRHQEAGEEKIVVKRVLALPGESVLIRDYDVWVGATLDTLTRVQKLPGRDADLLATYWDSETDRQGWAWEGWRHDRTQPASGGLALVGAQTTREDLFPSAERGSQPSAWNLVLQGLINCGYLNGFHERIEVSAWAIDFGVDLVAQAEEGTTLWVALSYGDSRLALSYAASGEASLWRDGHPLGEAKGSVVAPALTAPRRLLLLYLDGRLCLAVDGHDLLQVDVEQSELREAARGNLSRANGLAIAAAGGTVSLLAGRIVHDFHYLALGQHATHEPYAVPTDHYFVLGDNSQQSRDSRHHPDGAIARSDIVGRPLCVAAPWSRRRWLTR